MATSGFSQRFSASFSSSRDWAQGAGRAAGRGLHGKARLGIFLDVITIVASAIAATTFLKRTGVVAGARGLYHGTLFQGRSMGLLLAILCGYTVTLIVVSLRLHLYTPGSITNFLHEQRLSIQACLTAGLLLTGTLYLVHASDIPRSIVLLTIGLVTASLSVRRLLYRLFLHRRFDRGLDTRNVLIVGTGTEALALRHHIESIRHLGYTFKGFVDLPGSATSRAGEMPDVVGPLDSLFEYARQHFVDEIIVTARCEPGIMRGLLDEARTCGVNLRLVPELYGGLVWNSPIEYLGQFPTIPLHSGDVPEISLLLKRSLDIAFSSFVLVVLAPFLLLVAAAIKLDSRGPVIYCSERIGKKGRVFGCLKFRTMVQDAEDRRAELLHLNERDGVLFKIAMDPRITRVGRFLRKYSLDELPQFLNVLRGDMSVVGPRPPLASEVKEYKLGHLRRLDVTPGITGLWQVQSRRDPSFDSYVSLDLTYIENWNILLDLKIMVRTLGVILSGTGS